MKNLVKLSLLIICIIVPSGAYNLVETMAGKTFFDHFTFFTGNDPTHGYVDYVG